MAGMTLTWVHACKVGHHAAFFLHIEMRNRMLVKGEGGDPHCWPILNN